MSETRSFKGFPRRVNTPTLLQMEVVECGAASLGIMLSHYGRICPLAELRVECGVSRDGSNAGNMLRAARRYGLEAKGYSKDIDALREVPTPYVVFWNFNHFLVVEGFSKDAVHLNDPATGHRSVTAEEFEEAFTGVTLVMTPGESFQKGGRRPSVVAALRRRLRGFRLPLVYAVLAGFLLVVPGLLIPAFTQVFVDEVLLSQRDGWLRPLLLAMGVAVLANGFLKTVQLNCLRRLRLGLSTRMSAEFFWHILRLPVDFYAQRFSGEIGNRSQLNVGVAGVLSGQLAETTIDAVMMGFYAALMFFYDPTLTWIGIGLAAVNFFALRWLGKRRIEANMRLQQEYGKVSGASIAGLQSMETIKASGMESGFFLRWSGFFANASNARQDIELTNQTLGALPGMLSSLTNVLVLVIGVGHILDGPLSIGELIAFQVLMASFLRPVGRLVWLGRTMQELQGDMARLDDVLGHDTDPAAPQWDEDDEAVPSAGREEAPAIVDGADAGGGTAETVPAAAADTGERVRMEGYLEMRGVTFGYNPSSPPLVEDFHLRMSPGQRVALVGGSGSGKSTLGKLVCGLYRPWEGEVLFDGVARDEVPRTLLTNSLSLVDQELLLFGGSIRDNLTLWDSTVPERLLTQACEDAEIIDRVRALPGGFEAELIEGGGNLSGGERQRLEIARALVTNPSVLVLDEATSALDSETEKLVVERIGLRGCTCLIVAHRLSTIRDCDEIIVLDKGRVVERGNHQELWELGGVYADLLKTDGAPGGPGAASEEASP